MTDVEGRLRHSLRAYAELARPGQVRPLRDAPAPRHRRARHWLTPLAAAAAVVLVITGVMVAGRAIGFRPIPGGPGEGAPGSPPYYVTLDSQSYPSRLTAVVHDSRTGAVLASRQVPTGFGFGPIVAVAGNRSFVIASPQGASQPTRLFLLRVSSGGRAVTLSKLPAPVMPAGSPVTGLAVSADGRLALTVVGYDFRHNRLGRAKLEVMPLTGRGAGHVWTTRSAGIAAQPAWVANGRSIAFVWQGLAGSRQSGVRMLDASGSGTNLLAGRPAVPAASALGAIQSALPDPAGRTILATATRNQPGTGGGGTIHGTIAEFSGQTGRPLRVLMTTAEHYASPGQYSQLAAQCQVMSLAGTPGHALVSCWHFGRLDKGRFTRLPGFPGDIGAGSAAW